MNNLILVNKAHFGKIICDVYYDKQGNILMTREQIGKALGYSNPNDAIKKIHKRNRDRLDKYSIIVPLEYPKKGGDKMNPYWKYAKYNFIYSPWGLWNMSFQ